MYSPPFQTKFGPSNGIKNRRFSPAALAENTIHSASSKASYVLKNKYKKNSKKCHHRKCLALSQQSAREVKDLRNLVNYFLSHKFSAAGVSYIVRSRSRWRKIVWFVAVVLSLTFMGYMTFNVIKEYMGFPKMLIREEKISPKLEFPAVTLCSLNPLINLKNQKSSISRLMKLKELLEQAATVPTNETLRKACYDHPLCQWSWFNETCYCEASPCNTEFCLSENSSHCACSINVCRNFTDFTSCKRASSQPSEFSSGRTDRCMCSTTIQYDNSLLELQSSYKAQQNKLDPQSLEDPVYQVMQLIRHARTYDLVDVEEALLPSVNDLLDYGVKFDNLIISCSFDGDRCYRENFTVLYHSTYGRCYMFNYLGIKHTESPLYAYNYGSSSGLRLIMLVRKPDVVDILNPEIGARVVVHNPLDLPFVAEYGINVRPHDMSAIEVKKSIINRLRPPYGNCVYDEAHLTFPLIGDQPYSILGCQKACRHYYLMQSCNCTKRYYITGSVFYTKTTNALFCQLQDAVQHDCMVRIISSIEKGRILCDCRPPCTETVFSTTVSSSELNENYYRAVKNIRTFFTEDGIQKKINATDQDLMVGVKVYYSTFQVDSDNEQASYSWETLIANIGGNLGFFMGLTLLTFMEVLEFIWDVIVTSVRRYTEVKPESYGKAR